MASEQLLIIMYGRSEDGSVGIIQKLKGLLFAEDSELFEDAGSKEHKIEKQLQELYRQLARIKSETAVIMAEERQAKMRLESCIEEINQMEIYAQRAIAAGNETDAEQFLVKKNELLNRKAGLESVYEFACLNTRRMRETHDRLEADIAALRAQKSTVDSTIRSAQVHKRMKDMDEQ